MKKKIALSKYKMTVIAFWGGAAAVMFAAYFFLKAPQDAALSQLRVQFGESRDRADYARLAAVPESRTKLLERYEKSAKMMETFSTRQDAVTGLVFDIGEHADALSLGDFSSKAMDGSGYSTVAKSTVVTEGWLSVEFQGTFEQFVKYINELERNQPVVFLEKISFRRGTEGPASHQVTMDLSFLTQTKKLTEPVALVP